VTFSTSLALFFYLFFALISFLMKQTPPAAGVVYLRGRQKSAMLDSAATRRNRVATPASP